MAKLRKSLGDIDSPECLALMRLIETQSVKTLAAWAITYAREQYLAVYAAHYPEEGRLGEIAAACASCAAGECKLSEVKPLLKEAGQIARTVEQPAAQAAARAVAAACAVLQTPTNALGFLFYGAAAIAYSQAGLEQTTQIYDELAAAELARALASLEQAAVPDEAQPAKIVWHC